MSLRAPVLHWSLVLPLAIALGPADAPGADLLSPRAGSEAEVQLIIDLPRPQTVLGDPAGLAFLAGRVLAFTGGTRGLDIVLVIDTSDSTDELFFAPGSVPLARRGFWARLYARVSQRRQPPPEETLLGAEVRAALALLERLDPRTSRVGVVSFAGDWDAARPDSRTEVALTADFERVRRGLERVLQRGSWGPTNLVAGLSRAVSELLATPSAQASPRQDVRRVVVMLSDWTGLRPFRENPVAPGELGALRLDQAQRAGIRVDAVIVGEEADRHAEAALRLSGATGGCVTHLARPAQLEGLFDALDYTRVEQVRVRNRSRHSPWRSALRSADGGYSALVRLRDGTNLIEVSAHTSSGTSVTRELEVHYVAQGPQQQVPPRYLAARSLLLEDYLREIYSSRPDSQRSRQLQLEVAREDEREGAFPASPARSD